MVLKDMVFEALQDMRCCDRLSSLMMEAASSRAGIASSDANTQAHINVWSPTRANIIAAEADRKQLYISCRRTQGQGQPSACTHPCLPAHVASPLLLKKICTRMMCNGREPTHYV